jgi:glycosyltransferase involved in cell wall biosynthesis
LLPLKSHSQDRYKRLRVIVSHSDSELPPHLIVELTMDTGADRRGRRSPRTLRGSVRAALDTLTAYRWWLQAELATRRARPAASPGSARSLLLLMTFFPPYVAGGTYRPLSLARYGPGSGWDVQILTKDSGLPLTDEGRYLLESVPPSVSFERVPEPSLTPSHRRFPRIDGGFVQALASFRAGRPMVAQARPAVIFASGPSFDLFVTAYYLSRMSGARLVLGYRDEWSECPFAFVNRGNLDGWWERRCLRAADAVIFTTRAQLEHQIHVFPELDPAKCCVIPNGWEPSDFEVQVPELPAPEVGRFVLTYAGTLGPWTPPSGFLSTLARVLERRADLREKLRLHFLGRTLPLVLDEVRAFPWPHVLERDDAVPKFVACAIMRASHGLLLLNDNPLMERYIPGKVYDYIGAGPPILTFGEGGEVGSLIRELDAGPVVPAGDAVALERILDRLIGNAVTRRKSATTDAWLARHTREQLARDTFTVLERVVDGRSVSGSEPQGARESTTPLDRQCRDVA